MLRLLTIIIAKLLIFVGHLCHRGSVLPGHIAKLINKNILASLKLPDKIIAVTGSAGKGSTSSQIASVYRSMGLNVIYNDKGSNLDDAIISSLLEKTNLKAIVKADVVVLEIDECFTKIIFPVLKPKYVVITNITRDQPPRQGNVDIVYNKIKDALTNDMHLIINGDDPYLLKLANTKKCKTTYYSINNTNYDYKKKTFSNLNIIYCPYCHHKLIYDYYHFEELGKFECPSCHFKNINGTYQVTKLNLDSRLMLVNKIYKVVLPNKLLYSAYNTLSALTMLALDIPDLNLISEKISEININKDNNTYIINNIMVTVLSNKNENCTSFNQSLLFIARNKEPKIIVIGWKEISRRYKYNDLSWLYDIEFELLEKAKVVKIICVGINKYDIATRFKYTNISQNKIMTLKTLHEAVKYIKKRPQNVFAVLNFDYVIPFNREMMSDTIC